MAIEAWRRLDAYGLLRDRAAWWALGGLVAFLAALAIAISWRQPFVFLAVGVGALVPVLVRLMWRGWASLAAIVAVLVLIGVLGILAIAVILADRAPVDRGPNWTGSGQERKTETVAYRAQAVLDGTTFRLIEEISNDSLGFDATWASEYGWQLDRAVDGVPVYQRSRKITPRAASPVMSEVDLAITLGLRPDGARLVPGQGSMATIIAPKGALGVIAPAPQNVVAAPRQREVASVPLGPDSDYVTVTVRASWLRNPLGRSLDDFFAWGPVAWLVGAITTVSSAIVVARVTGGADRVFGGILNRLRHASRSPWRSPTPRPRKPLRGGDPGLVRRRRVRR